MLRTNWIVIDLLPCHVLRSTTRSLFARDRKCPGKEGEISQVIYPTQVQTISVKNRQSVYWTRLNKKKKKINAQLNKWLSQLLIFWIKRSREVHWIFMYIGWTNKHCKFVGKTRKRSRKTACVLKRFWLEKYAISRYEYILVRLQVSFRKVSSHYGILKIAFSRIPSVTRVITIDNWEIMRVRIALFIPEVRVRQIFIFWVEECTERLFLGLVLYQTGKYIVCTMMLFYLLKNDLKCDLTFYTYSVTNFHNWLNRIFAPLA